MIYISRLHLFLLAGLVLTGTSLRAHSHLTPEAVNLRLIDVPKHFIEVEHLNLTDVQYARRYHLTNVAQLEREGRVLTSRVAFAPMPLRGYGTLVPHEIVSTVVLFSNTEAAASAFRRNVAQVRQSSKPVSIRLGHVGIQRLRYRYTQTLGGEKILFDNGIFYRGSFLVMIYLVTGVTNSFGNTELPMLASRIDHRIQLSVG